MSLNYASRLPTDSSGNPMQGIPAPVPATAATVIVAGISSVVAINNNSTTIEIAATNGAVAMKWISSTAAQTSVVSSIGATANFDHIIPAASYRRFVIPRESQGIAGPALMNSVHGLYQRLAVIPVVAGAVSSILVTEF